MLEARKIANSRASPDLRFAGSPLPTGRQALHRKRLRGKMRQYFRCSECSASDHSELTMNVLVSRLKRLAASTNVNNQRYFGFNYLQTDGFRV